MYLRVEKKDAEEVRRRLADEGVLDPARKVVRQKNHVLLPIKREVKVEGAEVVYVEGEEIKRKPRSLREALEGKLTSGELELLPSSYDLIGGIAVLDLPVELDSKKKLIGESLIETFRNVRVVCVKKSRVDTEFRVREVEVVAGEARTETVHREYGCLYRLDVGKAYFSPRLGGERMRVASQVGDGERVLVLFAGVGPYPILIARKSKPKEVYAVELNPDAVAYMKENVRVNKVNVSVVLGDARSETPRLGRFDRIVMPLPKDAGDFLDVVLHALNPGGVVHFYDFAHDVGESERKVLEVTGKFGYKIRVLDSVLCGSYSPCLSRICVDFEVI